MFRTTLIGASAWLLLAVVAPVQAEDKPAATEKGSVYFGTVKSFDAEKNTMQIELPPAIDAAGKAGEPVVITVDVPATTKPQGVDSKPLPTPKGGGSVKPGQYVGLTCLPSKQPPGKQPPGKQSIGVQQCTNITVYPPSPGPAPAPESGKIYSTIGYVEAMTDGDRAYPLSFREWNAEKQAFLPATRFLAPVSLKVTAWYRDELSLRDWIAAGELKKLLVVHYYVDGNKNRIINAMAVSPGLLPSP